MDTSEQEGQTSSEAVSGFLECLFLATKACPAATKTVLQQLFATFLELAQKSDDAQVLASLLLLAKAAPGTTF